jgi:hypothetical protein
LNPHQSLGKLSRWRPHCVSLRNDHISSYFTTPKTGTLDSNQLQDIVARAIRSSETFVRLLTLENLDNVLPAELERLDTLKAATQSKYRFLVHRRTMLFQALNSSLISANHKNGDGTLVIGKLASQLADTIAECEKLSEELLSISDQMAQINKLIDIHWGSAFAIALRKVCNLLESNFFTVLLSFS